MASTWHPILNTDETSPGVWRLLDADGREYAGIELRQVQQGTLLRYRVEFRGDLVGWSSSLRGACMAAHQAFLGSMSAVPFAGYPKWK